MYVQWTHDDSKDIDINKPIDDATKELFKKLNGKTYIEEEFRQEN